ncbi:hypothetical protein BV881_33930 [Streptomyces sp. ZL-24]|uniref:hypothetical protein n=1 Tax=Streptomyces sp. ZL-24 TaxID=1933029 RepID=UPI000D40A060|nr:hypothetical protein [Streptomyces sp. ZL-24]POG43061.1 hypothetical protein BV881_33930 [Streptomyces sp. ZL-24]
MSNDRIRLNVQLSERASRSYREVRELTGDNEAEVIARALSLYAFVEKAAAEGSKILIQGADDQPPQELRII